MLSGRHLYLPFLTLLLLAGLSLSAGGCQSVPVEDGQPAGTEVAGPALIAYFTDN